jgi:hypothetical protein
MMSDVELFTTTPVPRPDELCARYAGKASPWYGFVLYGVLYFFLAFIVGALGMLPGVMLGVAAGAQGALWVLILAYIGGIAAFAASWVPFARWVKRRRASTSPLIRGGEVIEGRVFDRMSGPALEVIVRLLLDFAKSRMGYRIYRIELSHAGKRVFAYVPRPTFGAPKAGTPVNVLFYPASPFAFVFDKNGKASAAGVGKR